MARKPLVAGNWKMHFTVPEGIAVARELRAGLSPLADRVDLVLLPPAIMLWEVAGVLAGSAIKVGAQNAGWADQGAFTGEISPRMLEGWCGTVLLGHSERRHTFHETDEEIRLKLVAALGHDLRVILAVGETLEENEAGRTGDVIARQLGTAFDGAAPGWAARVNIAYEPVWAIGTGRAATPEMANQVMGEIRRTLGRHFAGEQAAGIRVLYGGSVTAGNATALLEQPEIDGALVGGASLRPADFTAIALAAAEIAGAPPP